MKNFGIILPGRDNADKGITKFLRRNRFENISIQEYGINFIVVYDDQNCGKIFFKNKVNNIILLTDKQIEHCDFNIVDGYNIYKKMIPDVVRKTLKSKSSKKTVTLVDRTMSFDAEQMADRLLNVCSSITIATENQEKAESVADILMEKYGAAINVIDGDSAISSAVAVVTKRCNNTYASDCIVIDNNCDKKYANSINDFYIPFKVKPPLGIRNTIFAQCIEITKEQNDA